VLRDEQAAAIDLDPDGIMSRVAERRLLHAELVRLAASRRDLVRSIALAHGEPAERVSDLVPRLAPDAAARVRDRLRTFRRALLASETALGVVGNNIANVNTPGYTRELPDLESDPSILSPQGVLVGTGVHVSAVRQVVDPLLERRLLGAETDRRQHEAERD